MAEPLPASRCGHCTTPVPRHGLVDTLCAPQPGAGGRRERTTPLIQTQFRRGAHPGSPTQQSPITAVIGGRVLAPRMNAHLIMVRGRPDRRIADTREVELVMRGGPIVKREALDFDPPTDPGFGLGSPLDSSD